jgi:GTP-binding protein EngB required for normal cell division
MMDATALGGLRERARRIQCHAEECATLPSAARMALRLSRALRGEELDTTRSVTIALLGGTGVGKSAVFNALLGFEASPTSVTRAHTARPYIAVARADQHAFLDLADTQPEFVDMPAAGLALIDTPDVDSVERSHRATASAVIETADVLVYITSPDKRANFDIDHEIRRWAGEARWFFVLNKIDTIPEAEHEAVRSDFLERVRGLGFACPEAQCFLVSAVGPATYALGRLRAAVFSSRAVEHVHALREEHLLQRIQHATEDTCTQPLAELVARLKCTEDELNERVRSVYRAWLEQPRATQVLKRLVNEHVWRMLSARGVWLLALPVWIRCRLSLLALVYSIGRLTTGPSLIRLVRTGWWALVAAIRGTLPLQQLARLMDPGSTATLRAVETDAWRAVEDAQATALVPQRLMPGVVEEPQEATLSNEKDALARIARVVGSFTAARKPADTSQQMLEALEDAVSDSAAKSAEHAVTSMHVFVGNLAPAIVLGQILWRMIAAWRDAVWLPFEFYLNALMVFMGTLLLGYLLLVVAVRARTRTPEVQRVVAALTTPSETAVLRCVYQELERLLREAAVLRDQAGTRLEVLNEELAPESFGTRSGAS